MSKELTRRVLLSAGIGAVPGLLAAGDVFHRGRRLCNRCCLPDYGYDQTRFNPPVPGTSLAGIPSEAASGDDPPAAGRRIIRTYQIVPRDLQSDHCRVSRIAVTLADSGDWSVNLDATQSPALLPAETRTAFERFHRNCFRLEVRPVLLITTPLTPDESAAGLPELNAIPAQTFWLQKDQQRHITLSDLSLRIAQSFHLIRQVNVYFSYR